MRVWANFCAKFEISLQTQENISKYVVGGVASHISGDPNIQFSSNSPDSKIRRIICASLGELLCATPNHIFGDIFLFL